MNKTKARAEAAENKRSIGDLRALIADTRANGFSAVNPAIPKAKVLEIYAAALEGRPDDEVPSGTRVDVYTGRTRPSRDALLIANILRDCT